MSLRSLIVVVVCVLLFVGGSVLVWKVRAQSDFPLVVDLSKDDAIQLLKFQYQIEAAIQARDQYAAQLYSKYKLSQITHQLDVASGKFLLKPEPAKEK